MSKFAIGIIIACILLVSTANGQQMQDVIYLKNGSIIRGQIVEQIPGVSVTIKTKDGNVFVYKVADIQKMTKETPTPGPGAAIGTSPKSPGLAFALSFLVPGLGQHYNGEYVKGIVQEIAVIGGYVMIFSAGVKDYLYYDWYWDEWYVEEELTPWFWIGLGTAVGAQLWSMIDAPMSAARINREMGYGHMIEFKNSRYALGLDVGPNNQGMGVKATLHF